MPLGSECVPPAVTTHWPTAVGCSELQKFPFLNIMLSSQFYISNVWHETVNYPASQNFEKGRKKCPEPCVPGITFTLPLFKKIIIALE